MAGFSIRRFLVALTGLLLLWWLLTAGQAGPSGWLIGVLAALPVAAWLAMPGASPGWRLRLAGLPGFLGFFLLQSFLGGLDVARRALRPGRPVCPCFLDYPLSLPVGPGRTLFIACLGLLPGSLAADVRGDRLLVHVLDRDMRILPNIERLEALIGALLPGDGDSS